MSVQIIKETATELTYTDTYQITVTIPKPPSGADLPAEDGIPLDSNWQRAQIDLLIELIGLYWAERTDFYVGGNMFIYFSPNRLKNEDVRGPDFFVVKGVDKFRVRRSWVVWEEQGRYPDIIIELISPSTQKEDEGRKKLLYENTFRTPEYFLYYPDQQQLVGWRLTGGVYQPLAADERGWLWSEQLALWLGTWQGYSDNSEYNTWLRFYEADGRLIPDGREWAIAAQAEAEAAQSQAKAAQSQAKAAQSQAKAAQSQAKAAQSQAEAAQSQAEAAQSQAEAEARARAEAEARVAVLEAELARLKNQPKKD